MGIGQMSALGMPGRLRRDRVGEINAQKGSLWARYAQNQNKQYQDKSIDLSERRFGLEKDMAHQARKRARQAQNMGYANLGLGAALGGYDAFGDDIMGGIGNWFGGGGGGGGLDQSFAGMSDAATSFSNEYGFGGGTFGGLFDDIAQWFE